MKNIYITWHYTTHGVAFLKHILSKFYEFERLPSHISLEALNQLDLNKAFDKPNSKGGLIFDKVVYITANQKAHDKISSRRFSHQKTILEDPLIEKFGLKQVYEQLIDSEFRYDLDKGLEFVQKKFPEKAEIFFELIWRDIQHYPVYEQIKWLQNYSNFKNIYSDQLDIVQLDIDDLREEKSIAEKVAKWSRNYFAKHKGANFIINVALGSSETQVVWHILAESGQLPTDTQLIKTFDDKNNDPKDRFKNFRIKEVPINLISSISAEFPIFVGAESKQRKLVGMKMKTFLDSGFSILLLGERGTGKSQLAAKARNLTGLHCNIIESNCASFANDSLAESELFGHVKGAFTDAKTEKMGLIKSAENGILFLDEIHHLSEPVQARLMKALQTDRSNSLSIKKIGKEKEEKVENVRLIFATNKTIKELKGLLLPDFYDRIVQHVIEIPPLRETKEDRIADWKSIWEYLKFGKSEDAPIDPPLIKWLNSLNLWGNFRDLQKIAMYFNVFQKFDQETKKEIGVKSAFDYAKSEFEKYHLTQVSDPNDKFNFNSSQTTKKMIADYCYKLQEYAVKSGSIGNGSRRRAIEHFRLLGDTVTEKTFNDWKNRRSRGKAMTTVPNPEDSAKNNRI